MNTSNNPESETIVTNDTQSAAQGQLASHDVVRSVVLGIAIGGALAAFTAVYHHLDTKRARLEAEALKAEKLAEQPDAASLTKLGNPKDYVEAYAWSARIRLEGLGLMRALTVTPTSDGKIIISGHLLENMAGRYELFKSWYHNQKTFPEFIDEVNILKVSGTFPQVSSVWLGPQPVVHFSDGGEARIGTKLTDGWTVIGINALAITLERDGMVLEVGIAGG